MVCSFLICCRSNLAPDADFDEAELEKDLSVPFEWASEYATTNLTLGNELWESINFDAGMVALPNEWTDSKDLMRAQPFPWDREQGLYILNGHHNLHCLVKLDQSKSDPSHSLMRLIRKISTVLFSSMNKVYRRHYHSCISRTVWTRYERIFCAMQMTRHATRLPARSQELVRGRCASAGTGTSSKNGRSSEPPAIGTLTLRRIISISLSDTSTVLPDRRTGLKLESTLVGKAAESINAMSATSY